MSEFDPIWSCRSKKRYGSEETANATAAQAFQRDRVWLRVYQCEACGGYHLTKMNARPQERWWDPPKMGKRAAAGLRQREDRRRKNRRGRH